MMLVGFCVAMMLLPSVDSVFTPAGPVGTKPYASLPNGSTAMLPCHYTGSTYGVYWTKENGHTSTEPRGDTIVQIDTYFNVGKRSGRGLDEGRFNISDDFSLVISPVMITDEGRYSCMVSDTVTGKTYSNSTEVTVFVYARKPFVNIMPCEHSAIVNQSEDLGETRCTYDVDNQTNFQFDCSVSGVKPNVSLSWETNGTDVEMKYDLILLFKDRGDGTFDQTLALTGRGNEIMNGTILTCVAQGLAVNGTATGSVIFVKTEPENVEPNIPDSPKKPHAAVIIVPLVIGFLVIVLIIVIWKLKLKGNNGGKRYQPPEGSPQAVKKAD